MIRRPPRSTLFPYTTSSDLLALRRDLGVAVVVGVVAGPAGHLGHRSVEQARHVVVHEEAAARTVVVDDVAEPRGTIRHGSSGRSEALDGASIAPEAPAEGKPLWSPGLESAAGGRMRNAE